MTENEFSHHIGLRRTTAIISHPDAGKTTLTEKLLLWGRAINLAGAVKSKRESRHATSDWMRLEQERGISVTTSVMQFIYQNRVVNLLDTPGHEDFSEDTYRTLTAVDSALMVVDAAKGIEERTIKLMEVCRLRTTPIMTFINKLDRESREPIDLLDEIEQVLNIHCVAMTWPIGSGQSFKGIYHFADNQVYLYTAGQGQRLPDHIDAFKLTDAELIARLGQQQWQELQEELALVRAASYPFDLTEYRQGRLTPVYFGTAMGNFGVRELLEGFVNYAPSPQNYPTDHGQIEALNPQFSGFVFKIQANMDPKHRDRIAFLRICSGRYQKNMKIYQVRTGKELKISDALTFLAAERNQVEEAWAGDIIGLHNHGTIQIGDTFTMGCQFRFSGIPHFAPELFKRVRLADPLKAKALQKGLQQLSEEGATQVFMPLNNNDLILGAVGVLQFDVVAQRLKDEYRVDCIYEPVNVQTARWLIASNTQLNEIKRKASDYLALDGGGYLTYLAPTRVQLQLMQERWPEIQFQPTREH